MRQPKLKKGFYKGVAYAPVTCGELVQGQLNGLDFLVTCPLEIYSQVTVIIELDENQVPSGQEDFQGVELERYPIEVISGQQPSRLSKAILAIRKTTALLDILPRRAWLELFCPVPAGKGMGSSTADIVATARATSLGLGQPLTPWQLARLALSIEPSDGVMFEGITLFDHRQGRVAFPLGKAPPAQILLFDFGGEVDTQEFNRLKNLTSLNKAKEKEVGAALRKVISGLGKRSLNLLGEGATGSTLAHQPILPKKGLEEITDTVLKMGAHGVICAHSGTICGILFPLHAPRAKVQECERYLSGLGFGQFLGVARLEGNKNQMPGAKKGVFS
ncbi:MAG: GHMP kinase [Firmicutes bacterium]|nr:GHMP kinase [Bacillota bacterium]